MFCCAHIYVFVHVYVSACVRMYVCVYMYLTHKVELSVCCRSDLSNVSAVSAAASQAPEIVQLWPRLSG